MHLRPTKQNGNPICPADREGVSPAIRDQLGWDEVQPVLDTQALRSRPAARESILDGISTLSTEDASTFDR
jgi:hypothetical protein